MPSKPRPPFEECPRFDFCGANVCPLDPDQHKRKWLPGEERCEADKADRMRIGSKYPELLPDGGLAKREAAGRRTWESKTPDQRAKLKPASAEKMEGVRAAKKQRREGRFSSVTRRAETKMIPAGTLGPKVKK